MFGNWLLTLVPHRFWFVSFIDKSAVSVRRASSSARYAVGFAVANFAILLRIAVVPYWKMGVPLVTFYPAVLFAAVLGGLAAGISATLVLAVAAAYLFFQPVHSFRSTDMSDLLPLGLFIGLGCLISVFVEMLIQACEIQAVETQKAQQARVQAESANEAKDTFLAMVSHELRNPLQGILGGIQVLRNKSRVPSEVERVIDLIERNARTEVRLVEELLDVSRISAGKMALDCEPSSLQSIVECVLEYMRPVFDEKYLQVHWHKEGPDRTIYADPQRIQQIVANLLTNAAKFTERGGRISVWLDERSDSEITLSVSDSGIGIDEDLKKHLFTPFRQGETADRHSGLGLGLAIVKRLVELHGGTIQAHSDGRGKGSTFLVRLPISSQNGAVA